MHGGMEVDVFCRSGINVRARYASPYLTLTLRTVPSLRCYVQDVARDSSCWILPCPCLRIFLPYPLGAMYIYICICFEATKVNIQAPTTNECMEIC